MLDLVVRPATPDDAEGIVAILNPIIAARVFTVLDTPFSIAAEREFILGFPARGVFHVAARAPDGRLVGFQNVEPFADYTRAFDHVGVIGTYVDLEHRRQGVATRLFSATFEEAARKGYEKMFTFVRADNPAALSTYLKHGFTVVGTARRHAKVDGVWVDEIIIERPLADGSPAPAGG